MNSHVIYEVSALVRPDLAPEWERYMSEHHIADVLATGCFLEAILSRSDDGRYRVAYIARSRESLSSYLNDHAARLRADALEHFPEGVELSRSEWEVRFRLAAPK